MTARPEDEAGRKRTLRERLLAARGALTAGQRAAAASSITGLVLTLPEIRSAATVACYISIGTEPSTTDLLDGLRSRSARGAPARRVMAPVLLDDLDLDWAIYATRDRLSPGPGRLWTPDGPRLGVDAVASADVVIVPALAVDAAGVRLGRGGGSYDRALRRVPAGRPVLALLYDGEVVPALPAEPHDARVTAAVTPAGVTRVGGRGPG